MLTRVDPDIHAPQALCVCPTRFVIVLLVTPTTVLCCVPLLRITAIQTNKSMPACFHLSLSCCSDASWVCNIFRVVSLPDLIDTTAKPFRGQLSYIKCYCYCRELVVQNLAVVRKMGKFTKITSCSTATSDNDEIGDQDKITQQVTISYIQNVFTLADCRKGESEQNVVGFLWKTLQQVIFLLIHWGLQPQDQLLLDIIPVVWWDGHENCLVNEVWPDLMGF